MKPVVVHIITGLNTGGAEMMLARLVERHATSAFDHRVICLTDEGPTADLIRSFGVPVQNLDMARGLPNPIAIRRLATLIEGNNAGVVQTWLYHADLIGGLAARLAHRPVAWGIHQSKLDPASTSRSLKLTVRACARLSARVPNAIVCCAEASRTAHSTHGYDAGKMVVIPNGFDTTQFAPDTLARHDVRQSLGIADDHVLIGIAGRNVPLKNHAMFIQAAGILARRSPVPRFVMIGEGLDDDNTEIRTLVARAGVVDRTHLLGRRPDMTRLLNGLDICALTSRTEAFPMVIGEAMATGVPCVSTDVGDAAMLIGETGRIVPSGDANAMADAWQDLIDLDPAGRARLGMAARIRMIEHFDITSIAQRYDALWTSLLGRSIA